MVRWVCGLFLFLLLGSCSFAADDHNSLSEYNAIVEQVKQSDKNADFQALRMLYTKTENYNPYDITSSDINEINLLLKQNQFEKVIQKIEPILWEQFMNIDLHFMAMKAYKGLENEKMYNWHRYITFGLIDSIMASGDGKTPEKAYIVINTREEYIILSYLGLKYSNQSLIEDGGHQYDRFDVENKKTGENTKLYFKVDILFEWMEKQFK
jgi:hypothetical protein